MRKAVAAPTEVEEVGVGGPFVLRRESAEKCKAETSDPKEYGFFVFMLNIQLRRLCLGGRGAPSFFWTWSSFDPKSCKLKWGRRQRRGWFMKGRCSVTVLVTSKRTTGVILRFPARLGLDFSRISPPRGWAFCAFSRPRPRPLICVRSAVPWKRPSCAARLIVPVED